MNNNGAVIWRGTSRLDNRTPVVAIVTGIVDPSDNEKTGDMLQVWFLIRVIGIPPHGSKSGRAIAAIEVRNTRQLAVV